MRLTFIGKDPLSNPDGSPTVYITDAKTFIIQGYVVAQEARAQMKRIPAGEDAVEFPVRMFPDLARAFLAVYERAAGPDTIKRPTEENSDPDALSVSLAGPDDAGQVRLAA